MKKGFLVNARPKRAAPPVDTRKTDVHVTREAGDAAVALERVSLVDEHGSKKTMAEEKTLDDAREPVAALMDRKDDANAKPLTIGDLPVEMLVSIFMALEDVDWVRHTIPRVCKAWAELYRSKDASPLHEKLEVSFSKEIEGSGAEMWACRRPVVHASRVISWAERRAGSVRGLYLGGWYQGAPDESLKAGFKAEDLGRLVQVVGPSLTSFGTGRGFSKLLKRPFWKALRDSVVPAGRLRSLVVLEANPSEADVEPLGQLAGSLEDLVLVVPDSHDRAQGLPRFPEFVCALTELRRLVLRGHPRLAAVPAGISSLKKLENLSLGHFLSSLPKELAELSGLTKLVLADNEDLGNALHEDVAFPAALGKLKSLRFLSLHRCGLRAVPAFVGELESLEELDLALNKSLGSTPEEAFPAALGNLRSLRVLDLHYCDLRTVPAFLGKLKSLEILRLNYNNDLQIDAPLDFLIEGCPRLREIRLEKGFYMSPWTPRSLAHLEAFQAKLRAKNPNARVLLKRS